MSGLAFHLALQAEQVTSHLYRASLPKDYSFGSNVHGGFVISLIQHIVSKHSTTTLAKLGQPHVLSLQMQFLRPTMTKEAEIHVKDVKIGSGTSVLHVTVAQDSKEKVVGYATITNMQPRKGVSLPTDFRLSPSPTAVDHKALVTGQEMRWISYSVPYRPDSFTNVHSHLKFAVPASGTVAKNITDQWITPTNPAVRFTTDMIGFVADLWVNMVENYRPDSIHSIEGVAARAARAANGTATSNDEGWRSPYWYPTLSMDLDIKKQLPSQGVEWLFVRAQAKEIKDGRMDAEVLIFDQDMQLVALAHHIGLIVPIAWNKASTVNQKGEKLNRL